MAPAKRRSDLLGFLGIANRAGVVVRGTDAVRQALRSRQAALVLLAHDAAPGQRGKLTGLLAATETPAVELGSREELGRALGASPLSAVAVRPSTFAERLQRELMEDSGDPVSPELLEEDGTHAG